MRVMQMWLQVFVTVQVLRARLRLVISCIDSFRKRFYLSIECRFSLPEMTPFGFWLVRSLIRKLFNGWISFGFGIEIKMHVHRT